MEINRDNYEIWFVDYFDHTLGPQDVAELLIFLEENPDLKIEFENYEHIRIPCDTHVVFSLKDELKKNNDESRYTDHEIIAYLEDDLDHDAMQDFTIRLKNDPALMKQVDLYKKTFLVPDKSVIFRYKNSIKRFTLAAFSLRVFYYSASAAAVLLLAFGLYNLYSPDIQPRVARKPDVEFSKKPGVPINDTLTEIESIPMLAQNIVSNNDSISAENPLPDRTIPVAVLPVLPKKASLSGNNPSSLITIDPRNQFSILFDYIMLREMEFSDDQSFAGRFFGSTLQKVIPFRNKESREEQNKSFVSLMIKGYSLMTDKDIDYAEITDKSGQVVAYTLNGERVELSRIRRHFQNDSGGRE